MKYSSICINFSNKKVPSKKELIIAQIYVLRANYVSMIDGLIENAKNSYIALSPSERTASAKLEIAKSLVQQGNSLEAECDARMDSLLSSLEQELGRLGKSTSVISEIKSIYNQEKKIKKAELMDAYNK